MLTILKFADQTQRIAARTGLGRAASAMLLLSICGCHPHPISYDYSKEPDPRTRPYLLGPSDELHITVWRNPNLTTDATIRPDGTITMPLVGDLVALGRTSQQLRNEIKQRLTTYVQDPLVTVAVTRVNSYRFTVAGKVARAGLFSAQRYVTVSEALAMAGGPTLFARSDQILIVRRQARSTKVRRIPLNWHAVASGKKPEQDIVLLSGDIIYVP